MKKILSFVVLLTLIAGLAFGIWRREALLDWAYLHNYRPAAAVATLASEATMTPLATHLFYVDHPQLEGRQLFNQACPSGTEQSVVLGCYHGDRQGIFLFDVTDPRLHGVEQVTAAHEMLHQAYDRLSTRDRAAVDRMLLAYYEHGLTDQTVKDQMALYQKSEPNDLTNEMHSVFGTEIGALPAPLEAYYKRYFVSRAAVVAFHDNYQAEFTQRKQQVAAYDLQLADLKKQIDANESALEIALKALERQRAQLEAQRARGDVAAYNAGVPVYNAAVSSYNGKITATKKLIAKYNRLVETRNATAVQEQQLQQALDSHFTPVSGQ